MFFVSKLTLKLNLKKFEGNTENTRSSINDCGSERVKYIRKITDNIRCEEWQQVFCSLHQQVELHLQVDGSCFQQLLCLVNVVNIHRICQWMWYILHLGVVTFSLMMKCCWTYIACCLFINMTYTFGMLLLKDPVH